MPSDALKLACCTDLELLEGDELQAYPDSGGIWTIGTGHTKGVTKGMLISEYKSREDLMEDEAPIWAYIDGLNVETPPNDLEYIALNDLAFNCGLGALKGVIAGTAKIEHYIHDHAGKVQPGLVRRRRRELAFLGLDVSVLDNPQPIPAQKKT
jgi:lysozyme